VGAGAELKMEPRSLPAAATLNYWEERARRFAADGAGLAAVCSYGMPLFYNRAIDLCQRLALQRWLRVRPGIRVLDVGCGVGRWSRLLAGRGASVQDLAALQADEKFDLVLSVTVLQHILEGEALRTALQRMVAHLEEDGVLILLEAAPERTAGDCDSAIFRARPRASYLRLFAECGLEVRALTGVDPAPFRTWLLPHLRQLPSGVRLAALATATALSLPIDVPFGRLLVGSSWHAVFVLTRARSGHAH